MFRALHTLLLVIRPFQLHGEHTSLQPFWREEPLLIILISYKYMRLFYLGRTRYSFTPVECLVLKHNIEQDISLKINLHQAEIEPE